LKRKKIFNFFNPQNDNKNKDLGMINEDLFEKAIQNLINQKVDLIKNKKLIAYHRAEKNGDLDKFHIDFLLILNDFTSIPIQIKSSTNGVKKHQNKYKYIFALMINKKYSNKDIEKILISSLNWILKNRDK
jgi:hypothetical protein